MSKTNKERQLGTSDLLWNGTGLKFCAKLIERETTITSSFVRDRQTFSYFAAALYRRTFGTETHHLQNRYVVKRRRAGLHVKKNFI